MVNQIPETKSVVALDTKTRFENCDRDDKVRGYPDLFLEVDGQAVRVEILPQDVQGARHILRPLVDDVEVGCW